MGNKKNKHLFIIILLLSVSCFFVYNKNKTDITRKSVDLAPAVSQIEGYLLKGIAPLEDNIVSVLELDDYANNQYTKNGHQVGLYIGYYFSLDKASAAHSPLVCFPGQGWQLAIPEKGEVKVGDYVINYEEFVAKQGEQKVLVMYWFQAGTKTSPVIYKNKINSVMNLVVDQMQEHAFVRVSVPLVAIDKNTARGVGVEFINGFYPTFVSYIEKNS